MKRLAQTIIVLAASWLVPMGLVSAATESEVVAGVQKTYEGLRDLTASFTQETFVSSAPDRKGPQGKGRLFLKKPGKMRWEFEGGMLFISDAKTVWQVDTEEGQVLIAPLAPETASITALNFLSGLGSLRKAFKTRLIPKDAAADRARGIFLELTPKLTTEAALQSMTIVVDPKSYLVVEAFVSDMYGNETHLTFSKLKTNAGHADALFSYQPKPGQDVIDSREKSAF